MTRRQSFPAAFRAAGAGVRGFARERNSRVHLAVAAVAVALGIVLRLPRLDWAVLGVTIIGVLALEAMNCAIERVVDLISPAYHELARAAKDLAAGAVLMASGGAVAVGLLLFVPRIIALWRPSG